MGGLLSDRNSFIGPSFRAGLGWRKHAAEILGPIRPASTLCSTLLNLSFVISYNLLKKKKEQDYDAKWIILYTNSRSIEAEYLPQFIVLLDVCTLSFKVCR